MEPLDLDRDVVALTAALVDIESVSGNEGPIADAVEQALRTLPHLDVLRDGNSLIARTSLGHTERVVIAGHLDTVPVNANLPSRLEGDRLFGLGSCDMKGGCAVALRLAATEPEPVRDVTYVFYECEEVEAERNGLGRIAGTAPELLEGDLAILMEPSNAVVEGGCQGTMQVDVTTRGVRAHTARSWMGSNAIHKAAPILQTLASYQARRPLVEGLTYHEGLNGVRIAAGVAGNVLPDMCTVGVNHRFAPDRTEEEAFAHLQELFAGFEVELRDSAPGAPPGLDRPAAAAFARAMGGAPKPKLGWTDVARFAVLGIPAVNFGPGDPSVAHTHGEHVDVEQLRSCEARVRAWLAGSAG